MDLLDKICRLLALLPLFLLLFVLLLILGLIKALIIFPFVLVIIVVGNLGVVFGLYPVHVIWTCYCIVRTRAIGILLKALIMLLMPAPILAWPLLAIAGTFLTGAGFGLGMPLIRTFLAARDQVDNKLLSCFLDGTWSSILGAFTIVRDFMDICFYSYFSVMDGLLEARSDALMEIRLLQIPGCILAAIFGVLIDMPMLSLIVLYKVPVMLYKGWKQLIHDLIGRSGPFLESVCVPFAGLLILLWPIAVILAAAAGILSSLSLGLYAAAVAYQENSTMSGILYSIAVISMFDEYTNDFLYMRDGSCFPRPRYRKDVLSRSPSLPPKLKPEESSFTTLKRPLIRTPSMKMQELKAVVIWQDFIKSCESLGKELVRDGAIWVSDLEAWLNSKNEIVNIGLPSYVFLHCFILSIKSASVGFILRDNVELTSVNRPEGRIFDWLFEPMLLIKEQIKAANLEDTEEAYLYKLTLYCGDTQRVDAWQNGGVSPLDEVKRAHLEGLSRRLQGFCLTLSRMPTFRRRFHEVVNILVQEARQILVQNSNNIEEGI